VIGDSAGYLIGRRWGERLLAGTIGRLPVIRRHLHKHLESARAYVLGGYALGAMLVALVCTVDVLTTRDGGRQQATPRAPMKTRLTGRRNAGPGADASASWRAMRGRLSMRAGALPSGGLGARPAAVSDPARH